MCILFSFVSQKRTNCFRLYSSYIPTRTSRKRGLFSEVPIPFYERSAFSQHIINTVRIILLSVILADVHRIVFHTAFG